MIPLKRHTNLALAYFFLVGLLGVFLRLFYVTPIPANYRYVVHSHSHIALLGWVYIALSTLIYKCYFTQIEKAKTYKKIFLFTNITILGMLVTFPFTGYALLSITFSTLFLIASYFFAWFVLKNIPKHYSETYSFKCIKAALWYMIISSIGPWALGGIMATLGSASIWYKLAIYFYLHFQYNGWFILALAGILFYILERHDLKIQKRDFKSFFFLLNSGIILSFFLSVLWVEPPVSYYILAGAGAVLQVLAFYKLYMILKQPWQVLQQHISPFVNLLFKLTGIFLAIKIALQLLTGIPYFANLSALYTDFVIGYLHWTFLGVISIALFAFFEYFQLMSLRKWAFWIYFTGFILSEILIFYKGTSTWLGWPFFTEYFPILLAVSALIPISVGLILFRNVFSRS